MNSNSETRMENSDPVAADGHDSSTKTWPTNMKELVDPKGPFIPKWNVIFIVSCVFSVLLDPLFLYIPIINDDIKCLRLDNNLKIAALVLRSATDLCYLLNIFFQVYSSTNSSALHWRISFVPNIANTMWRSYILIDILAVLPIPQTIVLIFYFNMRGSRSFGTKKLMNFFVLVQYVPRVFRIYLSCKEYSKKYSGEEIPIWFKGVLNFFLYILASHVMGAFWYFFAVQQITTCWQYACRLENGCVSNNLYCHDHHALRNIKFLDDLCSVDPPNEKLFNFGIFLDILQLGILGSTDYFKKFSNCFSWGLRSLSSFGSNLKPSDNAWENLFAAFISIIGLLLFLYLIGNLQTYMQLDTARLETHRWKMKIKKKMEKKRQEVEPWLSKNGIPLCKTSEIMVKVEVELKENKDVDVENILSILPSDLQSYMKSCMPLNRLKQVPLLQKMDERVLRAISEYLEPVKYIKNDIIIHEKKPLQKMIFIVEGLVIIEMRYCSRTLERSTGEVYGEKLLSWPGWTTFPDLPIATESARADGNVEALVLTASNMKHVGQKFRPSFSINEQITHPKWELLESDRVIKLKKVPLLAKMDEGALTAVSEYFVRKTYTKDVIIIHEKKPLEMMIFIVEGLVIIEMSDCSRTRELSAGEVYGEKLLTWPTWTSFPSVLPVATESVRADGEVEALVLMASDIQDVVSKHKLDFFNEEITRLTDDDWWLLETDRVNNLRRVPKLKTMDTRVLKAIFENLKPMSYEKGWIIRTTNLITKGKPLRKMVFVTGGSLDLEKDGNYEMLNEGEFYGEELLDWVLDESFPAIVPISTHGVRAGNANVLVLTVNDLSSVVSNFKSHFRKEITIPTDSSLDLCAIVGLTWLKKGPSIFRSMDEEVLKEISKHLKLMSYSVNTYIVRENNPLEYMFIFVEGSTMSIESTLRPLKQGSHDIGHFYGDELVHWVTNWASHATFPDKLPLSTCSVKVRINRSDTDNAGVLVLRVDDLKSIVTKFMSHFIKKTTLLVDSEWKLSTFDPLATLRKKVPQLEDMDEIFLEEIRRSLIPMRYNDMSPYIIEGEFDKMFLIESGLVCRSSKSCLESTSEKFIKVNIGEKAYCYSGNFCGYELLEWALNHLSRASDRSVPKSNLRVEAVGEVEALILRADDLIRLVSEFKLQKETADNEQPSVSEFKLQKKTADDEHPSVSEFKFEEESDSESDFESDFLANFGIELDMDRDGQ